MADDGVRVTLEQMWDLLQLIEHKLIQALDDHNAYDSQLEDHEKRLRGLESHVDLARRVADLEDANRDARQAIDDIRRRVWAIPSIAGVAAIVAIAVAAADFLTRQ